MCCKQERLGDKIKGNKFFIMILKKLGIDDKYTGYYYLVQILEIVINYGVKSNSFYKEIYPEVGRFFNTADWTIERNIRHLLHKTWDGEMAHKLKDFWKSEKKPTCRKFIFVLRDYIMSFIS